MGLDKITTKFQEALQAAQQLASRSAHAELKSMHVLVALLRQDGGIVVPILEKAGVDVTLEVNDEMIHVFPVLRADAARGRGRDRAHR